MFDVQPHEQQRQQSSGSRYTRCTLQRISHRLDDTCDWRRTGRSPQRLPQLFASFLAMPAADVSHSIAMPLPRNATSAMSQLLATCHCC